MHTRNMHKKLHEKYRDYPAKKGISLRDFPWRPYGRILLCKIRVYTTGQNYVFQSSCQNSTGFARG